MTNPHAPAKSAETIWQSVIDAMAPLCSTDEINTLRTLELQQKKDEWHLLAPSKFVLDLVKQDLLPTIEMALKKKGIKKLHLSLEMLDLFQGSGQRKQNKPKPFESNLNPDYQFHNFVSGPSNAEAFAAAERVASGMFPDSNPLGIYGGTGLGKSHLMHAIGNALRTNGHSRVMYMTAEQFVNQFLAALAGKTQKEFSNRIRNVDALLIDDVQFLGGKGQSQAEFFHTFNDLFDKKRQIVMTSDCYPREIEGLEDRLKSRFGSGLNVSVMPPELETRVAILQNKAREQSFDLPDDVGFFIASHIISNIRDLEGALRKVIFVCSMKGENKASIAIAKTALNDLLVAQNKQVTIENIQRTVARHYNLKPAELLSKNRKAHIVRARQVAMALTRELTRHSLPEIGEAFSRDHSTILHACKKIEEESRENPAFLDEYRNLKGLLIT